MRRGLAAKLLALVMLVAMVPRPGWAEDLGTNPSAEQLEKALIDSAAPKPDTAPAAAPEDEPQTRGLRRLGVAQNRATAANPNGAAAASPNNAAAANPVPVHATPGGVALDIKFALGSAELTETGRATIQTLAQVIARMNTGKTAYHYRLEGHTDTTGTPEDNLILSRERALTVREYLVVSQGIPAERIEADGVGIADLLDPQNPTSPVNRRVVVYVSTR